jgi:hypothetical protein
LCTVQDGSTNKNHPEDITDFIMRYNSIVDLDQEREQDFFETVSEEEIIYLWRSIKGKGLSEDEAWQAIVTGIALDMAFSKTKTTKQIEH